MLIFSKYRFYLRFYVKCSSCQVASFCGLGLFQNWTRKRSFSSNGIFCIRRKNKRKRKRMLGILIQNLLFWKKMKRSSLIWSHGCSCTHTFLQDVPAGFAFPDELCVMEFKVCIPKLSDKAQQVLVVMGVHDDFQASLLILLIRSYQWSTGYYRLLCSLIFACSSNLARRACISPALSFLAEIRDKTRRPSKCRP